MPSSAPRCRSSASRCARRSTCAPAQRVLDVAAGNGNVTLAAARRWCEVTSTDYVPRAARRAAASAPPPSACTTSTSARPTSRRCRSTTAASTPWCRPSAACSRPTRSAPPRDAARVPARRQDRHGQLDARRLHRPAVQDHRQARAAAGRRRVAGAVGHARSASRSCSARRPRTIDAETRHFTFRYRSPEHWLEVFQTYYGPVLKAFAALDAGQAAGAGRRPARADRPLQPRRRRRPWSRPASTSKS